MFIKNVHWKFNWLVHLCCGEFCLVAFWSKVVDFFLCFDAFPAAALLSRTIHIKLYKRKATIANVNTSKMLKHMREKRLHYSMRSRCCVSVWAALGQSSVHVDTSWRGFFRRGWAWASERVYRMTNSPWKVHRTLGGWEDRTQVWREVTGMRNGLGWCLPMKSTAGNLWIVFAQIKESVHGACGCLWTTSWTFMRLHS